METRPIQLIPLADFIESVKSEILAYQNKHQGEIALFVFDEVELEASVSTSIDANGKISIFAIAEFGGTTEQQGMHKVRIKFKMARGTGKLGVGAALSLRVAPGGVNAVSPALPSQQPKRRFWPFNR